MRIQTVIALVGIGVATGSSLIGAWAGREYSRQQLRDIANEMANSGRTNAFSVCLTEMWDRSGELDSEWKGKRFWALVDEHGNVVKE